MRWNSVIHASSEGDRTAEITVHMTEQEAAILTLALENLLQDGFGNGVEITEWYGFNPAHYVAINSLIQWLESASSMTREQLCRVNWWETFEALDAEEWAEFAPRCELPINDDEMPSCQWQQASEMTLLADLITACK